jgi:hypothetical protein
MQERRGLNITVTLQDAVEITWLFAAHSIKYIIE